ncbi:unnamed protein product [Lactuca virosa]|uniref:Uncharacterized protein n=1 Tax=Lactuca virosa TaxID=75947 RepID=A0AAU9LV09_9ASTR|nr:unnamed protein product [Lactuca virosa]
MFFDLLHTSSSLPALASTFTHLGSPHRIQSKPFPSFPTISPTKQGIFRSARRDEAGSPLSPLHHRKVHLKDVLGK